MSEVPESKSSNGGMMSHVLPVINTVSILVGIVVGLSHLKEISEHAKQVSKFLKISSIEPLEEFTRDYGAVQKQRARFMTQADEVEALVLERIAKGETGQTIYHSKELEDFHAISTFWERSATFVDLGYYDFEVIYNLKAFPHNFWNRSELIREVIGSNWYGKGKPLPDFLTGTAMLQIKYREADKK